jgi:hypothetical protein
MSRLRSTFVPRLVRLQTPRKLSRWQLPPSDVAAEVEGTAFKPAAACAGWWREWSFAKHCITPQHGCTTVPKRRSRIAISAVASALPKRRPGAHRHRPQDVPGLVGPKAGPAVGCVRRWTLDDFHGPSQAGTGGLMFMELCSPYAENDATDEPAIF